MNRKSWLWLGAATLTATLGGALAVNATSASTAATAPPIMSLTSDYAMPGMYQQFQVPTAADGHVVINAADAVKALRDLQSVLTTEPVVFTAVVKGLYGDPVTGASKDGLAVVAMANGPSMPIDMTRIRQAELGLESKITPATNLPPRTYMVIVDPTTGRMLQSSSALPQAVPPQLG